MQEQLLTEIQELRCEYIGAYDGMPFEADLWVSLKAFAQSNPLPSAVPLKPERMSRLQHLVEEAGGFFWFDEMLHRYVFVDFYSLMAASKKWDVMLDYSHLKQSTMPTANKLSTSPQVALAA